MKKTSTSCYKRNKCETTTLKMKISRAYEWKNAEYLFSRLKRDP